MDDLIRSKDSRYSEYENLLLERDQVIKEGGQIWTAYLKTFGELMVALFEEKVECIKNKKIIAYYQAAINRGEAIDAKAMEQYLAGEMAQYEAQLRRMLEDKKSAEQAGVSSAYAVKRSKELYRRLAKLLHPDLNPLTDSSEELQELWNRVLLAYGKNSVKELTELEVLVRKALKEAGAGDIQVEIPDLDEKIQSLREEIDYLRSSEPFIYGDLLEDKEAVRLKKDQMEEELQDYRTYKEELKKIILQMLQGGEVQIHV